MRYGRYGWPYLFLRIGLGLTFLWIGIDILRQPEAWIGYLPSETPLGLTREATLRLAGFGDVVLGLLFFVHYMPKLIASLAAIHLLAILVMHQLDAVLIRDVGLLGAALALATWPTRYHRRRHWWGSLFGGRKKSQDDGE